MTEKELREKFTEPSELLLKVRSKLIARMEAEAKLLREQAGSDDYALAIRAIDWQRAALMVRTLIDIEGKILKEDLE